MKAKVHKVKVWTADEEALLSAEYLTAGAARIAKRLGRSAGSVQQKWSQMMQAAKAEAKKSTLSKPDRDVLRDMYPLIGSDVHMQLGITRCQAIAEAQALGVVHVDNEPTGLLPHREAGRVLRALRTHVAVRLDISDRVATINSTDLEPTPCTVGVYFRGVSQRDLCEDIEHVLLVNDPLLPEVVAMRKQGLPHRVIQQRMHIGYPRLASLLRAGRCA